MHVGDVSDQLWRTAFESLLTPPGTVAPQSTISSPMSSMSNPSDDQTQALDAFLQGYPSLTPYAATTRSTGVTAPLHNQDYSSNFQSSGGIAAQQPSENNSSNGYVCRWANCHACYPSLSELVGHVNLVHLHPTNMNNLQPQLSFPSQAPNNVQNSTSNPAEPGIGVNS